MEDNTGTSLLQAAKTIVFSSLGETVAFKGATVMRELTVSLLGLHKAIVLGGSDEAVVFEGDAMVEGELMLPVDRLVVSTNFDGTVVSKGGAIDRKDSMQEGCLEMACSLNELVAMEVANQIWEGRSMKYDRK